MAATIQENLVMTAKNDKSATERVKKRKTIKELFNGFHGNYIPIEIDWEILLEKRYADWLRNNILVTDNV